MSDKLIIPFDGKSKEDIDSGGVFSFISYEGLARLFRKEDELEETEIITGLVIKEDGISFRIEKKQNP